MARRKTQFASERWFEGVVQGNAFTLPSVYDVSRLRAMSRPVRTTYRRCARGVDVDPSPDTETESNCTATLTCMDRTMSSTV